jgi:acyl-CoA reductase-like NAD-dependent aldehyde dehydrogenase
MAALTVAKKLECSGIHINNSSIHDRPTLPHGGHKDSGFGRFGGRWAIDTFTQSKTVTLHEGEPMGPWGLLK